MEFQGNKDRFQVLDDKKEIMDLLTSHIKENKDYVTKVVKLGLNFAVVTKIGYVFLQFLPSFNGFMIFEHNNETEEQKNEDKVIEFCEWHNEAVCSRPQYEFEDYREAIRKVRRILNRIK